MVFSGTTTTRQTSGATVFGDVNGDAIADFEFVLVGVSSVSVADFFL